MMRIVNLRNEIGDRQLQLMGPQPTRLCARRQTVALPKEQKDIRGLADDKAAGSEKRRREWRARDRLPIEKLQHGRDATSFPFRAPRKVGIIGTCLFEGQAHELAPSLNGRLIIELIAHRLFPP
jgi:hypothetical protein